MNLDPATLTICHQKLMRRLVSAQDELARREQSCGTYHDVRKMTKLREEIRFCERRLTTVENMMESNT